MWSSPTCNGSEAERVADDIGGTAVAIDVRDEDAIRHMVESTLDAHGPIDLFVSNAGFVTAAGLEDSERRDPGDVGGPLHGPHLRRSCGAAVDDRSGRGLPAQHCIRRRPADADRVDGLLHDEGGRDLAGRVAGDLPPSPGHPGVGAVPASGRHQHRAQQPRQPACRRESDDAATAGDATAFEGGVASGDGVLDPADVAALCLEAIRDERFLVLPHPEVATYVERKATDRDRWLAGMRRFQSALHPDGNLPGNAIAP